MQYRYNILCFPFQIEIFWREAVIMSKTEHPNVVKFYAVVPDGPQPKLTVLCEYMQHGCLRKYLAENPGYVTCLLVCFFFSVSLRREDMLTKCEIMLIRKLDKSDKVRIAMHAARGLAYLHAQNIIHFDVKCNNLLLYDNNPCKVCDYIYSLVHLQNVYAILMYLENK